MPSPTRMHENVDGTVESPGRLELIDAETYVEGPVSHPRSFYSVQGCTVAC
jgi:hypothetical protein